MRVLTYPEVKTPEQTLYEWFAERVWGEDVYLDLANRGNAYVELDNGRVVFHMMPTVSHQTVVLNLASALRTYARALPAPGRVLIAPAPIRLWPLKIREPDVAYYKAEHLDRVGEQVSGIPDFVAEVLSPSTQMLDTGPKMLEYALAGIPEYWLVDPERRTVAIYVLEGTAYRLAGEYSADQRVAAQTLPGFSLEVDELWEP
ncbi:MAG: Uma2 family endonuclease [Thermoflexales bacterium]|nr:Uma2 family endonuclease [Thermoflexales bacterium]